MLLENIKALYRALAANPKISIEKWEVGPPASEDEIQDFVERVTPEWGEVPDTFLEVYRELNGFHMVWNHDSKSVSGTIHLLPLKKISSYPTFFDWPQPYGEREQFFVLDFFSPELIAGYYKSGDEEEMIDTIYLLNHRDEIGDETGLSLSEYLETVITAHGLEKESRWIAQDSSYVYDSLGMQPPAWPFASIDDFVALKNSQEEKQG